MAVKKKKEPEEVAAPRLFMLADFKGMKKGETVFIDDQATIEWLVSRNYARRHP